MEFVLGFLLGAAVGIFFIAFINGCGDKDYEHEVIERFAKYLDEHEYYGVYVDDNTMYYLAQDIVEHYLTERG